MAKEIPSLGLDGFGTSDHSHYRWQDVSFLKKQKKQQHALHLEGTGLVGLEATILNRGGDLGVHPRYLDLVDYMIISEHVHKSMPFSEFYNTKRKVRKWIAKDYDFYLPKINRIINDSTTLKLNAIKRNPRSIFGHVFNFPLGVRIIPPILYERLDDVLEAMQSAEVALELHHSHINAYNLSKQDADAWRAAGDSNVQEFIHKMFHRAKDYSLHFSLGSDAHRLTDIFPKQKWQAFIKQVNISESQLITPLFFSD
ncbi:MAG: hypothetical protein ACFFCS_28700 [Candidatus Hodarchaeota archaeon]